MKKINYHPSQEVEETMSDNEKSLDSQLWHACAGGMVQMPLINSKVFYFPQGHAEHAESPVDFGDSRRIPPLILCRVDHVKYMADVETDEVYAKIFMTPLTGNELDYGEDDGVTLGNNGLESQEKPSSFAKTLTQSDANNGGGFSVPRYCAETIFPRLNYSAYPPVQEVLAKDVHGRIWRFRHIYRGTPRRHLLTTGWSNFVNEKKLVAGDSVVFLRNKNDDLCVGIRRAKRGFGNGFESPKGWNHPMGKCMYEGLSFYLREDENKFIRGNNNGGSNMRARGKVKAYFVIEAIKSAVNGQPFEVIYYPRASTPEFCVKASAVKAALRIRWCSGMRFKMAFETEDSSRISWFMGTISDSQVSDPTRWPGSPWRLLQVSWDEPDLLQNVKTVSPWLVELVSYMPAANLAPCSPPRKKSQISQFSDFSLDIQLPTPMIPKNLLTPRSSPLCYFPDNTPATGLQGARHSQYGISSPELRFVHRLDRFSSPSRISTSLIAPNGPNPAINSDDNSCILTIGNSQMVKKECKKHQFMLFGKVILTEEQLPSSSDLNSTTITVNSSFEPFYSNHDKEANELGVEIGQSKVLMESENVGRILDLSAFGSYEELYRRLAKMFGIGESELASRLLYRDTAGVLKHTENEPFLEFMKEARRLTIIMDSSSENGFKL